MRKLASSASAAWLLLLVLNAAATEALREKAKVVTKRCSDWSYKPCTPQDGQCGVGIQEATRHGLRCRHKVKIYTCHVTCSQHSPATQSWRDTREPQALTGTFFSSPLRKRIQQARIDRKERRRNRNKEKPQADGNGSYQTTCTYKEMKWSRCDPRTNTRSRTLILKTGSRRACKEMSVEQKSCSKKKRKCVYQKQQWTECNPLDSKMTRRMSLVEGGSECEYTRVQSRPCVPQETDVQEAVASEKKQDCRYDVLSQSYCDPRIKKRQQTLQLRAGDRACIKQKTVYIACTPAEGQAVMAIAPQDDPTTATGSVKDSSDCKYHESDWGPCKTNLRIKVLTLSPKSPSSCPKHKKKN